MPKNLQFTNIMQQITSMMPMYCDKCGTKHLKSDLEIISDDIEKVVIKLECSNCKNVYIFQINSPVDGVVNAKRAILKADISSEELKKFSGSEKIMNEEVLDVFMALKNVNNIKDFEVLFNRN